MKKFVKWIKEEWSFLQEEATRQDVMMIILLGLAIIAFCFYYNLSKLIN